MKQLFVLLLIASLLIGITYNLSCSSFRDSSSKQSIAEYRKRTEEIENQISELRQKVDQLSTEVSIIVDELAPILFT